MIENLEYEEDIQEEDEEELKLKIDRIRLNKNLEKFPDYVFDIHTKNNSKNLVDFSIEGCYIKEECIKYKNQVNRDIYISFKKMIEESKNVSSKETIFEKLEKDNSVLIGQLRTSKSKAYVYIPKEGNYVWKGPFKEGSKKEKMMSIRGQMFRRMKSKVNIGERVVDIDGSIWFKFQKMGNFEKDIKYFYDPREEKKIIDKTSINLRKLQELSEDEIVRIFYKEEFIKTLIDASILRTGDVGLWNVLIDEKNCKLIDYEETRISKVYTIEDVFTKTNKRYKRILEKGMKNEKVREMIIFHLEERKRQVSDFVIFNDWNPSEIIQNMINSIPST